jgi:hypothetical protein
MALQSSGQISLNDIHREAGGASGSQASINDSDIRGLIDKGSGIQMSFSEWYGASASIASGTAEVYEAPNLVGRIVAPTAWNFSDTSYPGVLGRGNYFGDGKVKIEVTLFDNSFGGNQILLWMTSVDGNDLANVDNWTTLTLSAGSTTLSIPRTDTTGQLLIYYNSRLKRWFYPATAARGTAVRAFNNAVRNTTRVRTVTSGASYDVYNINWVLE